MNSSRARAACSTALCCLLAFGAAGWLRAQPDATQETARKDEGLVVKGAVNREQAFPESAVQFWISLINETGSDIRDLRFLSFSQTTSLAPAGSCWRAGLPVCTLQSGSARPRSLVPVQLRVGEAVTFTAELQATDEIGEVSLSGVLGWRRADGRSGSVLATVGKVKVIDRWSALPGFELLKDLALPIALIFLGWGVRMSEQRRAQFQQTWSQMLQKSHENAERYYMPLSSALYNLRRDWTKRTKEKERKKEEEKDARSTEEMPIEQILCGVLVVLRRQREMARKIGGWYFKDRQGEDAIAEAWRLFFPIAEGRLKREDLNAILERMKPEDNAVETQRRLEREPSLVATQQNLQKSFGAWVESGSFQSVLPLLHVLEITLDFEMNRPYELWYAKKEKFRIADFDPVLAALAAWRPDPVKEAQTTTDLPKLLKLLGKYRARSRGWWLHAWDRVSGPYPPEAG